MRKRGMIMKKGVCALLACLLVVGSVSITTHAYTRTYSFSVTSTTPDQVVSTATKDDNEQLAYVTPTSFSGTAYIAVYSKYCYGDTESTAWTFTRSNYTTKKTLNYTTPAYAGDLYGLHREGFNYGSATMSGRWTP